MSAPVTLIILTGLASLLATLAILFGIHFVFAALFTAILRGRYPTLPERRAYLLRDRAYFPSHLDDTQRLEKIRATGATLGFMFIGFPTMFLNQLMCKWMGLSNHSNENLHWQLVWLGLLLSQSWTVLFGPWAAARGRLAREILRAPAAAFVEPAGEALTFWPHLGPDRLR